jgi:hypothetical protein
MISQLQYHQYDITIIKQQHKKKSEQASEPLFLLFHGDDGVGRLQRGGCYEIADCHALFLCSGNYPLGLFRGVV